MTTIVGALTPTISNGQVADAAVVMAIFAFIQSQVNSNACPKTAGSGMLKGDGAGGTAAAVAGTDYFAPGAGNSLVVAAAASTTPVDVAFSATPTFNAQLSNVHRMAALTANVTTFTISNPVDGQTIAIRFVQDGTGSRTVTTPATVVATGAMVSTASKASWLTLTYVGTQNGVAVNRWEGAWTAIP